MPDSVKSCGSSRRSISSRGSTTSFKTNWSMCHSFSDCYDYVCKAHHTQPLRDIKAHLSRNILSFNGDRIKYEDWIPLTKAIAGDKFLHYIGIRSHLSSGSVMLDKINCEKKVKEFTKGPVIFTKFMLINLMNALSECLSQSKALMCLQLQMLPLHGEPIQILNGALEVTKSLQHLSLPSCKIGDEYCEILCRAIRNTASLVSLDLSNNNLSEKGAASIAELLKVQEIARYGECWKHSLRYREVPNELIPGLRRVTINNNPDIGDKGLRCIIDVLFDDYWIKAIDMQNCGITDRGCTLIQKLLEIDSEIVIFDVRRNPIIDTSIIANIVETLALNSSEEDKGKYGWLDIRPSNPVAIWNSGSSVHSLRTRSAFNLNRGISKTESLIKSFSTPLIPRNAKLLDGKGTKKDQLKNTKAISNLSMQGIMKNIGKYSSIQFQDYSIRSKVTKNNKSNEPMKALPQPGVVLLNARGSISQNTVSRNTSLMQIQRKPNNKTRPQTSGGELTGRVTPSQPANVKSRQENSNHRGKTPTKVESKPKQPEIPVEENVQTCKEEDKEMNIETTIKKCKKFNKLHEACASRITSNQNLAATVVKQPIIISKQQISKKYFKRSLSGEETVFAGIDLSSSSDSDEEFILREKHSVASIRHTFRRFLESQENLCSDL
ncbi:protein Cep78 homolog isoform X2 [Cimex lectularius]|uniref:Centrosomal protein of 78 kDa n=1 Tax=Cimex lectularius TaxID=79782 RepID=A0A8I6RRL1_CIMLE|nr:protein Cep78 homolog isoform X2 [Cimex lectularius]